MHCSPHRRGRGGRGLSLDMEDPQESSPASRNSSKPEQAFLTGFANAFSFEPGVEESDGGVARQGVGVSEVGKVGRGRKRGAEEAGGDERTWSGERGRKKMAKIETEVHKVGTDERIYLHRACIFHPNESWVDKEKCMVSIVGCIRMGCAAAVVMFLI